MDLDHRAVLYIERAMNELNLARAIFKISTIPELKSELELKEDATFFSNVISSSYYGIFYSAKAFLQSRGIATEPPEEHRKTLEEFEKLAKNGEIDSRLLEIYESIIIKADELLGIFRKEKLKRGAFTYKRLPQANLDPAKESLENAELFLKSINLIIQKT
jgi:uncharacterized protein (UPF0332 family)